MLSVPKSGVDSTKVCAPSLSGCTQPPASTLAADMPLALPAAEHAPNPFTAYLRRVAPALAMDAVQLHTEPAAWVHVTAPQMASFCQWRLAQGGAPATHTVYCRLAASAGTLNADELARIPQALRYSCPSRANIKKAQPLALTSTQGQQIKARPDTPQGCGDAVLMCLLLDQGLRAGEVVRLEVGCVNLAAGTLRVTSRR
jgi:integrase